MNRQALRDKLSQLSIRVRAQEKRVAQLKKAGATTSYADALQQLHTLRAARQSVIEQLHPGKS